MYGLGLGYLTAALPVSFSVNSPVQYVGKQPTYRISNATPGAQVYWSSYKDGKDTGEVRAAYGHSIEANGSLEITGGNWSAGDVGYWQKEIEVHGPDGTIGRGQVAFQVVDPATVENPVVTGGQGGSFFQDTLFTVAGYNVTGATVILALGGIWAAKALKLIK